MLRGIRSAPYLAPILAGLALAGCAGGRQTPVAVGAAAGQGHGIYKVGQPYQVDGVWYYPAVDYDYDETGIASWYGTAFHGKDTANGEVFDQNALTAAHRTLPLPSIVEVTDLENGRSIEVRVNDRGPFARGRIIDVSRRVAQLLGFEKQGTAKVRVRILVPQSIQAAALARQNGTDGGGKPTAVASAAPAPRLAVASEPLPPPPGARAAPPRPQPSLPHPQPQPPPQFPGTLQLASATPPPLPEKVVVAPVTASRIYIQVGAFAQPANAWRLKSRLQSLGPVTVSGFRTNGITVFRVRLGPIGTVPEADSLLSRVVAKGMTDARIVVD